MRWKSIIVLLAVLTSVIAPPSLPLFALSGAEASIGDLDVCHRSAPALFSQGEMPCMAEFPALLLPPVACAVLPHAASAFHPLVPAARDDRPPKA